MAAHEPAGEAEISWWIRWQRAIGLAPLSLFAAYHLWQNWPALESRDAWIARARPSALGTGLAVTVLLLMAAHAGLGALRFLRRQPSADAVAAGRSRFQALTGALLLIFVVYHVIQVWPGARGAAHAAASDSYQMLWQLLGRPVPLVMYVLGTGALAFHLAHGWARSFEGRGASTPRSSVRYVAGLLGLALFVLYIQLIGRFALGEAVMPLEKAELQVGAAQ